LTKTNLKILVVAWAVIALLAAIMGCYQLCQPTKTTAVIHFIIALLALAFTVFRYRQLKNINP
jgi:hypothetical protein